MEQRTAKVNIGHAGGTASSGSKTCKVTLPTTWLEAMGVTADRRELKLFFDGTKITLLRHLSGPEFAKQQKTLGHEIQILHFYDGNHLCTTIYADFTDKMIAAENQSVPVIKTAFGNNPFPDWEDFQQFLESRCIPRQRAGLQEYLEALGLEEYDPLAIVEKTGGRMAEDQQWLTIEVLK